MIIDVKIQDYSVLYKSNININYYFPQYKI